MKKQMPKVCVTILALLLVIIVIVIGFIVFLFDYERGKRSDNSVGIVIYDYLVHDYESENMLVDMAEAVNIVMKEKKIIKKIRLVIREEMPGGTEAIVSLRNYYENGDIFEQYGSLQSLHIYGTERSDKGDSSPYNKASTYINLPDIKSLVVSQKIAKTAEEEGIGWYEIWPDLEYYEVSGN